MKTRVKVRPFNGNSKTKAFVELTLDDVLVVKGMRLVDGNNGLFIAMPSSKGKDGNYYDSVYPLKNDWRKTLEETAIRKYKEQVANQSNESGGDFN